MTGFNYNSSWFYGIHEYAHHKNSSYFTFFSQFNRPWLGFPYIEAVIFITLFIFSIFGNILILYQMFQTKIIRTVTNSMISNLVAADILFSAGSPFIAITRITENWVFGDAVCKAFVYLMFVCAMVMIWTMTVISIDRYICINKTTSRKITPRMSAAIIVLTWIVCFVSFIPLMLYFHTRSFPFGNDTVTICTLSWPKANGFRVSIFFTVIICLIGFIIPIGIMGVNYFRIIRRFIQSRRNILNSHHRVNTQSGRARKNQDLHVRDVKVVNSLILLVLLFMIMWLPTFIVFVFILRDGMTDTMQMSSIALTSTACLALANACVNPFLYGAINDRLRRAVRRCFACKTGIDGRQDIPTISRNPNSSIRDNTIN